MLHDMPLDQQQLHVQRHNSGLESMQSVEQALGNVTDQSAMDQATHEFLMSAHAPQPSKSSSVKEESL